MTSSLKEIRERKRQLTKEERDRIDQLEAERHKAVIEHGYIAAELILAEEEIEKLKDENARLVEAASTHRKAVTKACKTAITADEYIGMLDEANFKLHAAIAGLEQ